MTIDLSTLLPTLLYICLIVLVIVFVVIGIKLIKILDKTDKVLDDVERKIDQVDGVFEIIDRTTTYATTISDRIIDSIAGFIGNIFRKKRGRDEYEEK
jgi:uncharacterized protein YoxC